MQTGNTFAQQVVDCWPLGNALVTFETGNGLQLLLNLPEPAEFTKIIRKTTLPLQEFLTRDRMNFPYPSNVAGTTTQKTGLGTVGSVAYLENQYYAQSAGATVLNVPIMYELSNFSHTILSLDKKLFFGHNDVYFKFSVDNVNKWAHQTNTAGASVGAATLAPALGSLQNVYLYLAVEQNPLIIDQLVQRFNSTGLKFLIDYPIVTKVTSAASTNQTIVIPFVPAQGKFLKKIFHTVWNSTETVATALDCEHS